MTKLYRFYPNLQIDSSLQAYSFVGFRFFKHNFKLFKKLHLSLKSYIYTLTILFYIKFRFLGQGGEGRRRRGRRRSKTEKDKRRKKRKGGGRRHVYIVFSDILSNLRYWVREYGEGAVYHLYIWNLSAYTNDVRGPKVMF